MALVIIPVLKRRELEVRTATYGSGIDQSQHAKSVSHIITLDTYCLVGCIACSRHVVNAAQYSSPVRVSTVT